MPFEKKRHAIVYINSNCGAQSGRSEIMKELVALGNRAKVTSQAHGHGVWMFCRSAAVAMAYPYLRGSAVLSAVLHCSFAHWAPRAWQGHTVA